MSANNTIVDIHVEGNDKVHKVHKVDEVIAKINYKQLVKQGIVPDLYKNFDVKTKRYNKWIYDAKHDFAQIFSCISLFYDGLVRKMLSIKAKVDWGTNIQNIDLPYELRSNIITWENSALIYMKHLLKLYNKDDILNDNQFNKRFELFGKLNEQLSYWFKPQIDNNETIKFNTEYSVKRKELTIVGNPSLVTNLCVIDIKTSSGFKSVADQTFLQVLSYVALMRENKLNIDYMGVIFPLHCQLVIVNLSDWDSNLFLNKLFDTIDNFDTSDIIYQLSNRKCELPGVGHTIGRDKEEQRRKIGWIELIKSRVKLYGDIVPFQIMLTGRLSTRVTLTHKQMTEINLLVNSIGLPLYVHAPYTINLSKPWLNNNPDDKTYWINGCIDVMRASQSIGARGVVIHTGKPTKILDYKTGYQNLITNLHKVIDSATAECPLLLETPVGCGTEIGHTIEEFSQIYNEFTSKEKERFKICIDTCHVFAAGNDPYEYLIKWDKLHGYSSIGLVHFNDSMLNIGCRKDRHHYYTYPGGKIGYDTMTKIAEWCNQRNVHMVTE